MDPGLQAIVDRLILEPASAAEIAAELGIPVEGVRHRLRGLLAGGIVERPGRTRRRGVPEFLYACDARRTVISPAEAARLPAGRLAHADARLLRTMLRDVMGSLERGSLTSRAESVLSRALLTFDEPGWAQVGAIHRALIDALADSVGRAEERLGRGDTEPLRGCAVALLFEAPGPLWPKPVEGDRPGPRATRGALERDRVDMLGWAAEPIRLEVLEALSLLPAGAGPRELAGRIGVPVEKVRYETGRLAEAGLITVHGREARRGTSELIYSSRRLRDLGALVDSIAASEASSLGRWHRRTIQCIFGDALEAIRAGTFRSPPDASIARLPMRIDEAAFRELYDLLERTACRIFDLHQECLSRLARSGAEGRHAFSIFLLFESLAPATGP